MIASSPSRLSNWEEIKVPLAFGHLSVKAWGSNDGIPVLALHGWLDNAGSFDALAPLLPSNIYLLCLDFCGNGHSSPSPSGTTIGYVDYLVHIKLVFSYFSWKKAIILGHSMGGIVAVFFTAMFPEMVEKLICLDVIKQTSYGPETIIEATCDFVTRFLSISERMAQGPLTATVTFHEARDKLINSYRGSLDAKAAEILLIRGLRKKGEGDSWEFTRDLRTILPPITTDEQLAVACRAIRCPFLFIKANLSLLHTREDYVQFFQDIYLKLNDVNQGFQLVEVNANHHFHLTNPELVAPHISEFIFRTPSKL